MLRVLTTSLLLLASLTPGRADAQTLTIEVEAAVDAPSAPTPERASEAIVVVRPDGDARIPMPPVERISEPSVQRSSNLDDDEVPVEGWGHLAFFADRMDLADLDLSFGSNPEIEALAGVNIGRDWEGRAALENAITGGVTLGLGMRAAGYFRGPDIRFSIGGGELGGPFAPAQGTPDGFELSIQSIFFVRVEMALGLQIPLGPVTPYVVGIGSVGVGLIEVDVRDARLGGLGSETMEAGLFSAGFEAGIDVEVDDGLELGFAFRANVVGTTSMGGLFRIGFGGE